MFRDNQRIIYENPKMWGKSPPETVLQRTELTTMAVPTDVRTILEVGAGDGLIIDGLIKAGYNPVALDISFNALGHINTNSRVQGQASQLPFSPNSFDLVLCCELLEHIPDSIFENVLNEIGNIAKNYIIVTVPCREKLEWSHARCRSCGCIFNGAYHLRSFNENDLKSLFKEFRCSSLREIVHVLHPDRTLAIELFLRHQLASEYLYYSSSVNCPLCFTTVDRRPRRNWIGWIAAGMRYCYRIINRRKSPLWYLAVYEKS
jgi:SAM-dependent methyltransferase